MGKIQNHPAKHEFDIKYHDKLKQKIFTLKAHNLTKIEKGFLVFSDEGKQETFVPLHRIREVLHKGAPHWKAS